MKDSFSHVDEWIFDLDNTLYRGTLIYSDR